MPTLKTRIRALRRPAASPPGAGPTPTRSVKRPMRIRRTALLVGALGVLAGCQDFLDVNTNPNAPQEVAANLYLPPMLHWMVTAPQFDGRRTMQRHQMVYAALGAVVGREIHALSLDTPTPGEWAQRAGG